MSKLTSQTIVGFGEVNNVEKTEFPDVVTFEPLNPVTKGHRLFVPTEGCVDFAYDSVVVMRTMQALSLWVKTNAPDKPANVIISKGKEATQSVFQLHIHYVPRTKTDGFKLPWSDQERKR